MKIIVKLRSLIIGILILLLLFFVNRTMAGLAFNTVINQIKTMLLVIPPIFILLGLIDAWVDREVMMKYLGKDSGFKGIFLAFSLGSLAAGPLYGAFPMAAVLLKKGAKFSNILIFIGAYSTTKVPMFLFEASSLGIKFALIRLFLDIIVIFIMANFIEKTTSEETIKEIYSSIE